MQLEGMFTDERVAKEAIDGFLKGKEKGVIAREKADMLAAKAKVKEIEAAKEVAA